MDPCLANATPAAFASLYHAPCVPCAVLPPGPFCAPGQVVTYLQWQVLWHGYLFSQEVAAKVSLPGLRAELATGLRNDLSDYQWRDFRGSLAPLAAALSAYVGLSRMVRRWCLHYRIASMAACGMHMQLPPPCACK